MAYLSCSPYEEHHDGLKNIFSVRHCILQDLMESNTSCGYVINDVSPTNKGSITTGFNLLPLLLMKCFFLSGFVNVSLKLKKNRRIRK